MRVRANEAAVEMTGHGKSLEINRSDFHIPTPPTMRMNISSKPSRYGTRISRIKSEFLREDSITAYFTIWIQLS